MIRSRTESRQSLNKRKRRKLLRGLTTSLLVCVVIAAGLMIWHYAAQDNMAGNPTNESKSGSASPSHPSSDSNDPTSDSSEPPFESSDSDTGSKPGETGSSPDSIGDTGSSPVRDGGVIHLSFVGDVLLGSTVENLLKQYGYEYPYQDVRDNLMSADLTIANLETPITERGEAQIKEYAYRSSPKALPALAEAGIDLVNLANNHVLDYGEIGLLDTFDHLDEVGIKRFGAGNDAEEAFRPLIVEEKGMKIAFLGFSRVVPFQSWKAGINHPGVADTYNHELPVEAIEKARSMADLVVVVAHWGEERNDKPVAYQKELAHRYIDAGADLIIGGHPHVLQGFEQYNGKWIAYSLGNFIFTTNQNKETLETVILNAACSKDGECELQVVPIYTVWAKPERMNEEKGAKLLERLTGISFGAKVEADGRIIATD